MKVCPFLRKELTDHVTNELWAYAELGSELGSEGLDRRSIDTTQEDAAALVNYLIKVLSAEFSTDAKKFLGEKL